MLILNALYHQQYSTQYFLEFQPIQVFNIVINLLLGFFSIQFLLLICTNLKPKFSIYIMDQIALFFLAGSQISWTLELLQIPLIVVGYLLLDFNYSNEFMDKNDEILIENREFIKPINELFFRLF